VGQFGLCNGTFYGDMINMSVIIMMMSLGIEVSVGTSDNCKDCALCGESVSLLWKFLDLKWRWRWWIGFSFDLRGGVVWHGVCYLWHRQGVCYLWSWRRLRMVGCGDLVVMIGLWWKCEG
jgi:hypothetical protein